MTKPSCRVCAVLNGRDTHTAVELSCFGRGGLFRKEQEAACKGLTKWARETERNCLWEEKGKESV